MFVYRACVDIGGTFTDLILIDNAGKIHEYKTSTTPSDLSEGIINSLQNAANSHSTSLKQLLGEIDLIFHGTTIATNALVQRKTSRTALITTKGFRDIIEMRRTLKIDTRSMYDAFIPPYDPIVPRHLRFGVEEYTDANGEIITQLNEDELDKIIERLRKEGIEGLAICFINSYVNPQNEEKATKICKDKLPYVFIQYSYELMPEMGEYARESTCVVSASVGPVVKSYLSNLDKQLREAGFSGTLLIMQANQLAQSVPELIKKPVYLLGSGPAAAPPGGAYLGRFINETNMITVDMGGTTLDAALVNKGEVVLTTGKWFGDEKIGIKVADVSSIGAGGGSIAWFDPLGLLRVGPLSAGADPGPACYNKGGTEPTVTDAAVVLGYLPTDFFCGGRVPLSMDSARQAVNKVADRMNIPIEEAAQAIFTTINSTMADEITRVTTRMGYDIREFSLVACGGGGGMCGAFWGDAIDCKSIIIPNYSASFCAWSMFTLDIGRDYVRSYVRLLTEADPDELNHLYEEMIKQSLEELHMFNVSPGTMIITKSADLRYQGQYHEVEMELPPNTIITGDIDQIAKAFHRKHEELYTFSLPWVPIQIRNLRMIARIKGQRLALAKIPRGTADPSAAKKRSRPCYFNGEFVETPIYDSEKLMASNTIHGPAIIEVPTTTVVIPRKFHCEVDDYNNYIITRSA